MTTESVLLLECELGQLACRRGEIEGYLSQDAIKAHCETIEFKRFDLLARDLGAYEHAAHDRVDPVARSATSRRLRDPETGHALEMVELLAMPRGALIVASSGYGKTQHGLHVLTPVVALEAQRRQAEVARGHVRAREDEQPHLWIIATLASCLIREAMERRWEGKATSLPLDVFLPDLALRGRLVEGAVRGRSRLR